jgi:hypothetical protein
VLDIGVSFAFTVALKATTLTAQSDSLVDGVVSLDSRFDKDLKPESP